MDYHELLTSDEDDERSERSRRVSMRVSRKKAIEVRRRRRASYRRNAREHTPSRYSSESDRAPCRHSGRSFCEDNNRDKYFKLLRERRGNNSHRNRIWGRYHPGARDRRTTQSSNSISTLLLVRPRSPMCGRPTRNIEPNNSNIDYQRMLRCLNNTVGNEVNHSLLPEFDPSQPGQSVHTWLLKVNEYADMCGWPDQVTLHYAVRSLRGVARDWYLSLPTVRYSWDKFQKKIKSAFPTYNTNYGYIIFIIFVLYVFFKL